jgi:hypothetical protein
MEASDYLKFSVGPLQLSIQRTYDWPDISVAWRSEPVVAALPDGGGRVAFTNSVKVQGSGRWLGRSITVRQNFLEYQVGPDADAGMLPAEKATAGVYVRVNNAVPVMAYVLAGALVAGALLTQGQILNLMQNPGGPVWAPAW